MKPSVRAIIQRKKCPGIKKIQKSHPKKLFRKKIRQETKKLILKDRSELSRAFKSKYIAPKRNSVSQTKIYVNDSFMEVIAGVKSNSESESSSESENSIQVSCHNDSLSSVNGSDRGVPDFLERICLSEDSNDLDDVPSVKSVFSRKGKKKSLFSPRMDRSVMKLHDINKEGDANCDKNNMFVVPSQNIVVIVLDHPTSISIQGMVNVQAISGSIRILGTNFDPTMSPIPIFSAKKLCYMQFETRQSEKIWKNSSHSNSLRHRLENMTSKYMAEDILSKCKNSSVVVVLEKSTLHTQLNFVQLYMPFAFHLDKLELEHNSILRKYGFTASHEDKNVIKMTDDHEFLVTRVLSMIHSSKVHCTCGPRVLVYGAKNSGKSTLLRYLINNVLSVYGKVYYLDADPGQTEFTPPGCVSLTEVTDPLLGPAFTHQKDPLKMIFIGNISVDNSPEMYIKNIMKLIEFYNTNYSSEPLFINTMGWLQGLGGICLQNVMEAVKPTVLVELIPENKYSVFNNPECKQQAVYIRINVPDNQQKRESLPAPIKRDLAVLSYFGRCQKPFESVKLLNSVQPYSVPWKNFAMYIFGKHVPPEKLADAMNASFIALCSVDESLLLESSIQEYPRTVEDDPENECLGFGIVRAIDVTKKILYIITPIPLEKLKRVNALMKGNIMLPKELFLLQDIVNIPLPFTRQVIGKHSGMHKTIKKRSHRT